ncbi:MAG: hypothetical protein HVN35_10545 [Methanobacteriaceae archaeon]|nr:hypothetical protein [Methanobacteriaceae archaeon]
MVLLVVVGTSFADVINPGEKNIPLTYQISNIQSYPDYVFILHGSPNPSMEVLNSSPFSFYKLSVCSIYAVPKSVYNELKMNQMDENQASSFLNNDSRVARSNLELKGIYGTVPLSNPLESALIILKINSIQGNNLDIQKDKIIYSYSNGQTVEQPFQNQNQTPTPDSPPSWDYYIYFILLPIIALIIILFIAIRRRPNK